MLIEHILLIWDSVLKKIVMVFLSLGLTSCSSAPTQQFFQILPIIDLAAPGKPGNMQDALTDYAINVGDELEIKILDRPNLTETVKVRPDGKTTLPLIGDIIALGKSPEQLGAEIDVDYRNLGVQTNHDEDSASKEYRISVTDELEIKFP